jgi:hypothetical protein
MFRHYEAMYSVSVSASMNILPTVFYSYLLGEGMVFKLKQEMNLNRI